jgi:hypothetical protein
MPDFRVAHDTINISLPILPSASIPGSKGVHKLDGNGAQVREGRLDIGRKKRQIAVKKLQGLYDFRSL